MGPELLGSDAAARDRVGWLCELPRGTGRGSRADIVRGRQVSAPGGDQDQVRSREYLSPQRQHQAGLTPSPGCQNLAVSPKTNSPSLIFELIIGCTPFSPGYA